MRLGKLIDQICDRLADGGPVGRRGVARLHNRILHGAPARRIGELWKSGAGEQGAQRKIGERRAIERPQMRVALSGVAQQGIA